MAGIREWIRSRSKSRSRNQKELKRETQAIEAEETKNLPPLPLLRADSTYRKRQQELQQQQQQQQQPPSGPSDTSYFQNQSIQPIESLSPQGGYDNLQAAEAPRTGTYPLHGNASRPVSQGRNSTSDRRPSRTFSLGSRSSRPFSSNRTASFNRASLPPGTAVTTDFPAPAPQTSLPQHEPVSSLSSDLQDQYPAAEAPAVPTIPGQYRHQSPKTSTDMPGNRDRVYSSSSKGSASSRTPIAEQFAQNNYYGRDGGSPTPSSNIGAASSSANPTQSLRHQNDVADLGAEAERGRAPRSSQDRVPAELRQAPWNRADNNVSISQPLNFGGSRSGAATNGTQDRQVDALADQMQPMSINNGTSSRRQETGVINNTSSRSVLPGAFPDTPSFEDNGINPFVQGEVRQGATGIPDKALAVKNSAVAPSLKGVVDLTNTEDTSVHTRTAPEVVHETVHHDVHHIRHEEITREIHTHDVYHRELPIIDVQVLPARHFVPTSWIPTDSPYHPNNTLGSSTTNGDVSATDGVAKSTTSSDSTERIAAAERAAATANANSGFTEVPHTFLPERTVDKYRNKNWVIAETASKLPVDYDPKIHGEPPWRRFSARVFEGTEGDYKEWVDGEGVKRSEQTWVHPPTHATELRDAGLTQPLYMDEP